MTNIEKTLKDFDELSDENKYHCYDVDRDKEREILKGSLFREYSWPESQLELDEEKVRAFLSHALTQTRNDTLEELLGKLPKKREFSHISMKLKNAGIVGHNKCLSEVKQLLTELKDK